MANLFILIVVQASLFFRIAYVFRPLKEKVIAAMNGIAYLLEKHFLATNCDAHTHIRKVVLNYFIVLNGSCCRFEVPHYGKKKCAYILDTASVDIDTNTKTLDYTRTVA